MITIKGQTKNYLCLAICPHILHPTRMRSARLLGEGRSFYHVVSRVVDRRRVFEGRDKEIFRKILRNQEAFSGVRVVTYCLMSNHFHLLLEVPPMKEGGLSDDELLKRLSGLYSEAFVAEVASELTEARKRVAAGAATEEVVVERIHSRFTYRMHDLSQFMKGLLIRFTDY